jgi:hypothetical protein
MLRLHPVPIVGSPPVRAAAPVWRPANVPAPAPRMGQTGLAVAGTVGLLLGAGVSGGIGYAGYYLATHQRPVGWKVLGYGIAIIGGLSALGQVIGAILVPVAVSAVNRPAVPTVSA